ncbi:MAG TPA: STAS domain-containing protein [Actinomycetota bacterium]|nr:STAS domain-containing protein [Actinomycetota bacterium]
MSEFEAVVRQTGSTAVMDLKGQIDSGADRNLSEAYEKATQNGATCILLNFAEVDYINSTGIALVVGLLAQARASGREIRACGLSDHYKEIFEITRLADFVSIFPDEASAVA